MNDYFSSKHGYRSNAEITVREDAPSGFRYAIISLAEECPGVGAKFTVNIVRRGLGKPPTSDWSPDALMRDAQALIEGCDWWRAYDIAEMIYSSLNDKYSLLDVQNQFENGINEFCNMHGIGWKMIDGRFQVRGDTAEDTLKNGIIADLNQAGKRTTANELDQAVIDLSKRPTPDITGAVQHVGAAIECLARECCGNQSLTLGDIIKRHPNLFPGAYKKLAEAIWGITSNKGRHLAEGGEPSFNEAMLLVGVTTSLCGYLLHEIGK